MKEEKEDDYSDIIDLPYPVSNHHPRMSMMSRAAQFSAFEALSGHSERIDEAENENLMQQGDMYLSIELN